MSDQKFTDAELISAWPGSPSIRAMCKKFEFNERGMYSRRRAIEERYSIQLKIGDSSHIPMPVELINGDGKAPSADAAVQQQENERHSSNLKALLRKKSVTMEEAAGVLGVTRGVVLDLCDTMERQGVRLVNTGGRIMIPSQPISAVDLGAVHEYPSRPGGEYCFGFISDTHFGSKYAREDVAADLFEVFKREGVDRIYHAGNWVDGEASFNRHDLIVHGMHGQCAYLAEHWPRSDLVTYAVTGDDHEGWWAQREGVDVGRYQEQVFRDAGRKDWVDLGYMESNVAMIHAESEARAILRVAHPGGGSAYATSYTAQKYIEALDGGEKPAVVLLGHYHKMELLNVRNVWIIQTGCTQDQTPFGRKKKLDFHVGGGVCWLKQDERGAIIACRVEFRRYFNKGYYNQRWSHHGPVQQAERTTAP